MNVRGSEPELDDEILPPGKYRIGDTVNQTLRAGLKENPDRIIFGEDVEDPKGGVFRLTQKLSTEFPDQVFNSPAGGIDDSWRGLRPRGIREATGL